MTMDIAFQIEQAGSRVALDLIAALDDEILARYPELSDTNGIDTAGFEAAGGTFIVAYYRNRAAACGAFRPFEDAAEIKRMFVAPEFRRLGLARRMLAFVEMKAAQSGFSRGVLETGRRQPEAIALYRSAGWREIPLFGQYVGNWYSLCFEKQLSQALFSDADE